MSYAMTQCADCGQVVNRQYNPAAKRRGWQRCRVCAALAAARDPEATQCAWHPGAGLPGLTSCGPLHLPLAWTSSWQLVEAQLLGVLPPHGPRVARPAGPLPRCE